MLYNYLQKMHLIQKHHRNNQGFTIVELLIVIVVIAILAAITIVAYNGIRNRANDSTRAHDIQQYQKALTTAKTLDGSIPEHTSFMYIGSSGYGSGNFTTAIIDKGYLPKRLLDPAYSDGHNGMGYIYSNRDGTHAWILGDTNPDTYAIRYYLDNPPSSGSAYSCATSKGIFQAGTQAGATSSNQCVEG